MDLPADENVVRIVHMSDLHLRGDENHDKPVKERVTAFIRALIRDQYRFHFLVVSGDLIDGPRFRKKKQREVLSTIRAWLQSLCANVIHDGQNAHLIVAPGNHDYRVTGLFRRSSAIDMFTEVFAADMGFRRFDEQKIIFACFDTNVATKKLDFATGTLAVKDLARYSEWFATQKGCADFHRVAVFHHHPLPVADAELSKAESGGLDFDDFLRLRNAGTILKRLLHHDFEFILHGHLHAAEHWSLEAASILADDKSADPSRAFSRIDVLSAGTAGAAVANDVFSINTVELFGLGRVRVLRHDFADHGGLRTPQVLLKRGFEHTRSKEATRRARLAELPLECTSTICQAIVTPRTGVIVAETHHAGLVRLPGKSIDYFPVTTRADAMTSHPDVTARLVSPRISLNVDPPTLSPSAVADSVKPLGSSGHKSHEFEYTHRIDCANASNFESSKELVFTRTCTGGVVASAEQLRWLNRLKKTSTEAVGYRCRFREDLLQLNIYFSEALPELVPQNFEIEVRDENGRRCTDEEKSPSVTLTRHHPWIVDETQHANDSALSTAPARAMKPDVSLTVHRPMIGFTYKVQWTLPNSIPQDVASDVSLRKTLSKPTPHGSRAPREKLNEFCAAALESLKQLLETNEYALEPLDVGIYTFTPSEGVLRRWGHHEQMEHDENEGLPLKVAWGRGIIGEAYRVRSPMLWERSNSPSNGVEVPEAVTSLYAIPLWKGRPSFPLCPITRRPIADAPLAVVCFASSTAAGQMAKFFASQDRRDDWQSLREKLGELFTAVVESAVMTAG